MSEVAALQEFKDRVRDKLKNDIGSLMPDEVLQTLVQSAIRELFFDRVPEVRDNWGNVKVPEKQSWFMEAVREEIMPILQREVRSCIEDRKQEIADRVREFMGDKELSVMLAAVSGDAIRSSMAGVFQQAVIELKNQGIIRY